MKPVSMLLAGALVVGTLDILDAIVFFGIRNKVSPVRIFHSIASGLIGKEAATGGGVATAALGLALHFLIAFLIVCTCYLLGRLIPGLLARPPIAGPLYGIAAYGVMNAIVLPLSAIHPVTSPPWPVLLNGLLIHIFGIGFPSVLFARAALGVRGRG